MACLVLLSACGSSLANNPAQPYATIRAYETRVAALQNQIGKLSATLAVAATPGPTATPQPFARFWKITIIGAVQRKAMVGDQPGLEPVTASGVFVVVPVAVTNLGATPAYFIPTGVLQVVDERGRHFDLDPTASGAAFVLDFGYDPAVGPLQPGIASPDVLVFDVAEDATGLSLTDVNRSFSIPLSA
jgi:hypothetical protein